MTIGYERKLQTRILNACQRLRDEGFRVTPQRLAIVEFVFRSTQHPTVKEIHEALSARFPTMSLMTVYQTVHLLATLGQIGIASTQSEHTHYDGTGLQPHPHLVCQRCGTVVDAIPSTLPSLQSWPQSVEGLSSAARESWRVAHWRVEGIGLCPDCQRLTLGSRRERKEVAGRGE